MKLRSDSCLIALCIVIIFTSTAISLENPNHVPLLSDTNRQKSVLVVGPIGDENYYSDSDSRESKSDQSESSSSSEETNVNSSFIISKSSEPLNLKYIGCYDVWENSSEVQYTDFWFKSQDRFAECVRFCKQQAGSADTSFIVLVQDPYCRCNRFQAMEYLRVEDKHCGIECPASYPGVSTCGGSYSYSAYCRNDDPSCIEYVLPPTHDLYSEAEGEEMSDLLDPAEDTPIISPQAWMYAQCANCSICSGVIRADNTFIPDNSVTKCMNFCNREVHSYRNEVLVPRFPTRYFALGWTNKTITTVSICTCLDDTDLDQLEFLDPDLCNAECPGDPEETCGEKIKQTVTVYARDSVAEPVPPDPTFPPSSKPIFNGSTLPEPSTTTEIPTPTMLSTTSFTPKTTRGPNTVPETSTTSLPFCTLNCTQTDQYGTVWTECAGEIHYKSCPGNISGQAYWKCLKNGKFAGKTPNYSNCKTPWYENIQKEIQGDLSPEKAKSVLGELEEKSMKAKDIHNINEQYFGHEIPGILEAIDVVVRRKNISSQMDLTDFESISLKAIAVGNNVLQNSHTWEQLENPNASITKFIQVFEEVGFELLEKARNQGLPNYTKEIHSYLNPINFIFETKEKALSTNETYEFADIDSSHIRLPSGWEYLIPTINLSLTGMSIRAEDVIRIFPNDIWLPPSTSKIDNSTKNLIAKGVNGPLMSLSLVRPLAENHKPIQFSGNGVEIKFLHDVEAWGDGTGVRRNIRRKLHPGEKPKAVLGSSICVYWNTTYGAWSDDGCKLIKARSGSSATYCECSHLTSFAVLMDRHSYVGKDFALEVLTLVLCPLSIISLFVAITIFTIVHSTHGARTTITKNLAVCLLIGNTLVLLVTDRHYFNMNEGVCTASAMLTHYIYLSAFIWMGIEGYHLYNMMVYVFDSGSSHTKLYRILAYGCPLVFVALIALIGYLNGDDPYGGDEFCWLQGNYIWAFMVPVAVVVLGNLIVLIITMKTAYRVQTSPAQVQARTRSYKTWIRGCFSITIILGLTWVTGFFMMVPSVASNIAAYIFTILNASQGFFICIFHCLLTEKVRMAAEKKNIILPSWLSSTSSESSERTSFPGRPTAPSLKPYYYDTSNHNQNNFNIGNGSNIPKVKQPIKPSPSSGTISSDSGYSVSTSDNQYQNEMISRTTSSGAEDSSNNGSQKILIKRIQY